MDSTTSQCGGLERELVGARCLDGNAAKSVITKGELYAEQIIKTASLHGDVLNEPGAKESTGQMSADEGSQGIPHADKGKHFAAARA
jgi:hypothetical protein